MCFRILVYMYGYNSYYILIERGGISPLADVPPPPHPPEQITFFVPPPHPPEQITFFLVAEMAKESKCIVCASPFRGGGILYPSLHKI